MRRAGLVARIEQILVAKPEGKKLPRKLRIIL
jgi:hypothetical protein